MNLKQLLIVIILATIIAWGVWVMFLYQIDPTQSGIFDFALFYSSLFISLVGTFFLASFAWRRIFNKFSLEFRIVGTSFRQAIFLSFLLVGLLFLEHLNLLTWWNIILFVMSVVIVEYLFISQRRAI
ncbi:MAG: hypothetical protein WCP18_04265 [bacterium]